MTKDMLNKFQDAPGLCTMAELKEGQEFMANFQVMFELYTSSTGRDNVNSGELDYMSNKISFHANRRSEIDG